MRWRLLLRPSWLALTALVFTFAVVCFSLLAPWQFQRHAERDAQNTALQASFTSTPTPLPADTTANHPDQWERITVTGTYVSDAEVVARLRTVQGEPAFEVLTPLRTGTGQVILINRGYLRPDERTKVPPYPSPPTGQVDLIARVRAEEADPDQRPAFADESTAGKLQIYLINSRTVGQASGLEIRPGYFQLDGGQPGILNPLPLPQLTAGPYLSYALQWLAFGTMAIFGWLYFTARELRTGGVLSAAPTRQSGRRSVAQLLAEDDQENASIRLAP